jgi:hypothetical protein
VSGDGCPNAATDAGIGTEDRVAGLDSGGTVRRIKGDAQNNGRKGTQREPELTKEDAVHNGLVYKKVLFMLIAHFRRPRGFSNIK